MAASPDWAALDRALDHALDLDGPDRDAFVASLDAAMRDALAPLLRDALADDALLDHPATALADLRAPAPDAPIAEGVRIGAYEIEGLVGEGGMGRVFRAHRADGAFDQTVAIKVVRTSLALAGADVAARLRRERDVLAALDHPGIARLLDGGETEDGVPYLVTEFVDGAPITTWADAHALGVEARVRLMIEVARAVDHAHRRLIVHRDLKPSNVLVTQRDGATRPVVLDFGIAKLLDAAEAEGTAGFPLTRTGLRLLTPAYAAPELFEPTATVTTAADVYGLGALLYELLTGRRAYSDIDAPAPPTTEATRPSRAVRLAAPATEADQGQRARALRGDLDTICLKALHPDPARRYASAAALADDLTRFLDGRPVEARPDSLAYVAGRFVRRNRPAVLAATVAVLGLVGGLGSSLVSLRSERAARAEAETLAERATESSNLMRGLFLLANPEESNGRVYTVREALDESLGRVADVEDPDLRGYLLTHLGSTYNAIGEFAVGDSLLRLAVRTLDAADAPADLRADARYQLGRLEGGQGRFDRTVRYFEEGLALLGDGLGPELVRYNLNRDMAWVLRETQRLDASLRHGEQALRLATAAGNDERRIGALQEIGSTYASLERFDEARATFDEVNATLEREHGPDHVITGIGISQSAWVAAQAGDWAGAERQHLRSLAIFRKVYGVDGRRIFDAYRMIGEALLRQGRAPRGLAYMDSAMAVAAGLYEPDYPPLAEVQRDRADALNRLRRPAEAERAARAVLAIAAEDDGLWTGRGQVQLGLALAAQGRPAEARTALQSAVGAFAAPDLQSLLLDGEEAAARAALTRVSGAT